jgi:hypothetical protein
MPAVLGVVDPQYHHMRCARADFVIASRAPIRLDGA